MSSENHNFNLNITATVSDANINVLDKKITNLDKQTNKLNKDLSGISISFNEKSLATKLDAISKGITNVNKGIGLTNTLLAKIATANFNPLASSVKNTDSNIIHLNSDTRNFLNTLNSSRPKLFKNLDRDITNVDKKLKKTADATKKFINQFNSNSPFNFRNPKGDMINTYRPYTAINPMQGLFTAIGFTGLKEVTWDLGVKDETNRVLMENMGASYENFDKITNESLTSIQDLIPAMNSTKAIAGLNADQVNEHAATVAEFGSYVKTLTGSQDRANEGMMRLAKGFNGQFAGVDQYGITRESLKRTGKYAGEGDSFENYMAAVQDIMGTQMNKLMDTMQGQITQTYKAFSRAGKELINTVMPVAKTFLKIFNGMNKVMGGLPAKLIIISGVVLGLAAGLINLSNNIIATADTFMDLRTRLNMWRSGTDIFGRDYKENYMRKIASTRPGYEYKTMDQLYQDKELYNEAKEAYRREHPIKAGLEDALRDSTNRKGKRISSAPNRFKEKYDEFTSNSVERGNKIRRLFGFDPVFNSEQELRERYIADLNMLSNKELSLREKFQNLLKVGKAKDVYPNMNGGPIHEKNEKDNRPVYRQYLDRVFSSWKNWLFGIDGEQESLFGRIKRNIKELSISRIFKSGRGFLGRIHKRYADWMGARDELHPGERRRSVHERIHDFGETVKKRYFGDDYQKYADAWHESINALTNHMRRRWNTFLKNISKTYGPAYNRIHNQIQQHVTVLRNIWDSVLIRVQQETNTLGNTILNNVRNITNNITSHITSAGRIIDGIYVNLITRYGSTLQTLRNTIISTFTDLGGTISANIANIISPENWDTLRQGARTALSRIRSDVITVGSTLAEPLLAHLRPVFSILDMDWAKTLENLRKRWDDLVNHMITTLPNTTVEDAMNKSRKRFGGFRENIGERWQNYKNKEERSRFDVLGRAIDRLSESERLSSARNHWKTGKDNISKWLNEKDAEGRSNKSKLSKEILGANYGRGLTAGGFFISQLGSHIGGTSGEFMQKAGNAALVTGMGVDMATNMASFLENNPALAKALSSVGKKFGTSLLSGASSIAGTLSSVLGISVGVIPVIGAALVAIIGLILLIKRYWDNIVSTATNFFNWVKNILVTIFVEPLIPVLQVFDDLWNTIMGIFGTQSSGDFLVDIGNAIITILKPIGDLIMFIARVVGFLLKTALIPLVGIMKIIIAVITTVANAIKWLIDNIVKLLQPLIDFIKWIIDGLGWIFGGINSGVDNLVSNNEGEFRDYDHDGFNDPEGPATSWAKTLVDQRDHPENYEKQKEDQENPESLSQVDLNDIQTNDPSTQNSVQQNQVTIPKDNFDAQAHLNSISAETSRSLSKENKMSKHLKKNNAQYSTLYNSNKTAPENKPTSASNVPKSDTSSVSSKELKNSSTTTPITNNVTINIDHLYNEEHIDEIIDKLTKVLTWENIHANRIAGVDK